MYMYTCHHFGLSVEFTLFFPIFYSNNKKMTFPGKRENRVWHKVLNDKLEVENLFKCCSSHKQNESLFFV